MNKDKKSLKESEPFREKNTGSETLEEGNSDNNIISGKNKVKLSKIKRKIFKHVWFVRIVLIIVVLIPLFIAVNFGLSLARKIGIPYYYGLAKNFLFTPDGIVDKDRGLINILILGKGGKGHEAPDLTDTIIFTSINTNTQKISLISLPRDIWITEYKAKINSLYYYGNQKAPSGGIILAESSVENIIDRKIDHTIVVDFSGFRKIIDVLGGVDVVVDRDFTDNHYPIAGKENDGCDGDRTFACRYMSVSFKQGLAHMDGETALIFARSRYADGDEGSDFARAARQQKIIEAIKAKLQSKQFLTSPSLWLPFIHAVSESIETNITPEEASVILRYAFDARNNIQTKVLPEDLLINPPISPKYDNLYVFIPKDPTWVQIHDFVDCMVLTINCEQN